MSKVPAKLEVELLLAHAMGLSREALLLRGTTEPPQDILETYQGYVDRLSAGEPVARIIGVKEFWSLEFKLNEETLVPRPDSEALVEVALDKIDQKAKTRILDLGTGTGCLLLSILSECPKANGTGIDISKKAVICAQENAENLSLADCATFMEGDWMSNWLPKGPFDLILSNPPYIETNTIKTLAPEVAIYDPRTALDGGEDGLFHYRTIIPLAFSLLRRGGWLVLEFGEGQGEKIINLLKEKDFSDINIYKDLAGIDRIVCACRPDF